MVFNEESWMEKKHQWIDIIITENFSDWNFSVSVKEMKMKRSIKEKSENKNISQSRLIKGISLI